MGMRGTMRNIKGMLPELYTSNSDTSKGVEPTERRGVTWKHNAVEFPLCQQRPRRDDGKRQAVVICGFQRKCVIQKHKVWDHTEVKCDTIVLTSAHEIALVDIDFKVRY